MSKKAKAHQRYKTSDGRPCVGVTTVLNVMAKPALIRWANKLGLDGYDSTKYVDALADIGTLTHYLVECDVLKQKPKLDDYSPNQIKTAEISFSKWKQWKGSVDFVLIESELQLSSDTYQYGGTCDIYAWVNGKKNLIDIKTAKACYSEQRTQVVAYKQLLKENGKEVDECRIIRIGRSENEGFEDILIGGEELHFKRFLACLNLYWINKTLENSGA